MSIIKKSDFNKNFFFDDKRKFPVPPSKKNESVNNYLKDLFKTSKFIENINKLFDKKIYYWAIEYSKKTQIYPLRHLYGLLAIAKTIEYLSLNEKFLKKFSKDKNLDSKK